MQDDEHVQGIQGRTEHAIQLRGDHHVAGFQHREQGSAFRAVAERHGAGHPAFDEHPVHGQAEHERVTGDGPLLHVEALAFLGLPGCADPCVSVDCHGCHPFACSLADAIVLCSPALAGEQSTMLAKLRYMS